MLGKKIRRARIAIAVIGLIISVYLVAYSQLNLPLACPSSNVVNCDVVLNSLYAKTFGISNSYYGILFFLTVLALIHLRKPILLMLLTAVGIGFDVYFLYLEHLLGAICLYCTAVHITVIALFAISLFELQKAS